MADKNPITSAGMHRRLAEAADGFRTGEEVWFTGVPGDPGMEVMGPFGDERSADLAADERGDGYAVFGPYRTDPESPDAGEARVLGAAIWAIDPAGSLKWNVYAVREFDAIFLNESAFDKFAVPYMARVYGAEYAKVRREEAFITIRESGCCHNPPSGDDDERCPDLELFDVANAGAMMSKVVDVLDLGDG